jgi:hypothetical protein
MDYIAYQLTKYSIWLFPIALLILGVLAWVWGYRASSGFVLLAGVAGICWNILFMPLDHSMPQQAYWRTIFFVEFEEAPLGHFLSVYLPIVSKLSLITGVALLLKRHA